MSTAMEYSAKVKSAAEVKADMLAHNNAPVAKRVPSSQSVAVAGVEHEVKDEYQWLRGKEWPKLVTDPDIIAYLEEENGYCKDFLASLGGLQEKFFEKMKGRMKLSDKTLESKHGAYWYYSRTEEELQYAIDCRIKYGQGGGGPTDAVATAAEEEIILDRNKLAEGKKFCKALATTVSLNGGLMAYRMDDVGDENYCLKFMNLQSGEYLPDELWNVASYCFKENPAAADAPPVGLFYSLRNKNLRSTKVFYHKFGEECVGSKDFEPTDKLIFQSKNEMFSVSVSLTPDKQYVRVRHGSKTENEEWVISVIDDEMKMNCMQPLKDDVLYSCSRSGQYWFMKTKEGCKRDHFRMLRCVKKEGLGGDLGEFDWQPYIAEKSSFPLEGFTITQAYLGLSYLNCKTGQPKLIVRRVDAEPNLSETELMVAGVDKLVIFPGVDPETTSHVAEFSHTTNFMENWINVAVDTPVLPTTWYRWDFESEQTTLLKQKEVPNYNAEEYGTERFYAHYTEDPEKALHPTLHKDPKYVGEGKGEVSIPVTVLYKKSLFKKDGSMPLLLEGYGSYGISEEPCWRNTLTLYADLGFVVATAHIRGGGDLGEPWYQAAKFLSKKRTFLDFIACADKLAAEQYTSVGNVAICGGSAGGMLVGACLNMRPDLFKAVVAHVPFVTVLDTMLDGELPLTPGEFKEWGNPREEHYFEYIQSYCPYENVGYVQNSLLQGNNQASIFATAGLSDYRVGYYECAKWIARIRAGIKAAKLEAEIKEPLVIMETNMNAGHAGASGRFDRLKEVSRDVAFLATEFEIDNIDEKLS